jgi:hypothetical protein
MRTNLLTLAGVAACLIGSCVPALAVPVATTPEPSTILLVAVSGGALLAIRKLRNKK